MRVCTKRCCLPYADNRQNESQTYRHALSNIQTRTLTKVEPQLNRLSQEQPFHFDENALSLHLHERSQIHKASPSILLVPVGQQTGHLRAGKKDCTYKSWEQKAKPPPTFQRQTLSLQLDRWQRLNPSPHRQQAFDRGPQPLRCIVRLQGCPTSCNWAAEFSEPSRAKSSQGIVLELATGHNRINQKSTKAAGAWSVLRDLMTLEPVHEDTKICMSQSYHQSRLPIESSEGKILPNACRRTHQTCLSLALILDIHRAVVAPLRARHRRRPHKHKHQVQ